MTTLDIWLLATLPVLLVLSAFFSGSETALFGMSVADRSGLRQRAPVSARATEHLLAEPRMLLITVLLGNMAVNVLYFVISSELMIRLGGGPAGQMILGVAFLLIIVLLGEVLPKVTANSRRLAFAGVIATPLLMVHGAIGPIRILLDRLVVTPLARLTAPSAAPRELSADELKSLIELSSGEGVLGVDEQRILQQVVNVGQMKVREVMTPRVRVEAVPVDVTRAEVVTLARRSGWTRLPVFEGDLDHIIGILHVKRFLLDRGEGRRAVERALTPPRFVPQMATLEQLFEHFHRTHSKTAIVVDEYGGTAGLVSIEDAVEPIVGELADEGDQRILAPQLIGLNCWEVDGGLSGRDWAEMFRQAPLPTKATTLGGIITERLGRAARPGDAVVLGNVRLEAVAVERSSVTIVHVTLLANSEDEA